MYTYRYPRPAVTVDAVVFRKTPADYPDVLLIRRLNPPFKDMWALPGGFIDMDETPEDAVVRELEEETGLTGIQLTQFHTFGAVDRDPRHRTISIAYTGFLNDLTKRIKGGDDAAEAAWFPVDRLPELAFDHMDVITTALNFMREKTGSYYMRYK